MTKADIISEITEQTGLQKKEVAAVVESFMECVKRCMLDKKENVYLRGFGTFTTKTRAAKIARNILANTSVEVPEHKIPAFKASHDFAKDVR